MKYERAIVVGASSGLGKAIAEILAEDGCRVAVVAPTVESLRDVVAKNAIRLVPFAHDVRMFADAPKIFQEACKELGGLDLIVYCAGVMPEIGPSEFDFAKDREILEVNLLGAVSWLNEAARRFESTGRGTIVGIGSVAGDRGRRGQPVYNASKAALATYLEALRNRLSRLGVKVVTIKPGPMRTPMTANLHLRSAMDPVVAARLVLKKSRRTGEHYLKFTHKVAFAVIRAIPSFIFRRLKI